MPARDSLEVKGTVVDVLKHGVYRVELANGHRCIAKVSSEARLNFVELGPNDLVSVEFHPYDLSRGRIVGR